MKEAIELNIYGIKCDSCDFEDKSVKVEEYDQWLNKPCPNCEANLLTEADYNNVKMIIMMSEIANKTLPKRENKEEVVRVSVEMNGSGEMDFKLKDQ